MPQPIPLEQLFGAPRPSPTPAAVPLDSLFPSTTPSPMAALFAPPSPSPLAPPVGPDVVDLDPPEAAPSVAERVRRFFQNLPPGFLPSAFDSTPAPTVQPLQGTEAMAAAYHGAQGGIGLPAQAIEAGVERATGRPASAFAAEAVGRLVGAPAVQEGAAAAQRVAEAHPDVPGIKRGALGAAVASAAMDESTKVAGRLGIDPATYFLPASKVLQAFFVPGMIESAGKEFAEARALYEAAGNKVTPDVARAAVRAVASTAFAGAGAVHLGRGLREPTMAERVARVTEAEPTAPTASERPAAPSEPPTPAPAPAPARTVVETPPATDLSVYTDQIPEAQRPAAQAFVKRMSGLMSELGRFDEDAFRSTLPEGLADHAQGLKGEIVERAAALIQGRDALDGFREAFPEKGPDGVTVERQPGAGENDYVILQREGDKIVGGAIVRDNTLAMVAGGRELSGVSIGPVMAKVDELGVKRNDVLTPYGKGLRRTFQERQNAAVRGPAEGAAGGPESGRGDQGPATEAAGPVRAEGEAGGPPPAEPPTAEGVAPEPPPEPLPAQAVAAAARSRRGYSAVKTAVRDHASGLRPSLDVVGDIKGADGTAGPKIKAMAEGYLDEWERPASRDRGDLESAIRYLTPEEQTATIRVLDEGAEPTSPRVEKAAKQTRSILDRIARDAREADVFVGYRENYFPHRWAEKGFDFEAIVKELADEKFNGDVAKAARELNQRIQFGERRNPNLERERTAERASGYERSMDVLRDYIVEARERIALAKHFGPKMEKVQAVIDTIPPAQVGSIFPRSYAQTFVRRLTGREAHGFREALSSRVRSAQAVTKLGLASITQFNQVAPLVARTGVPSLARGVARLLNDYEGAKIDATRSGSLWPNIVGEASKAVSGRSGFSWGVGTADRFMRVLSDATNRAYFNTLAKGGRWAELESLGAPRALVESNPAEAQMRVAKTLTDFTQTRTGVEHLPLWATSPEGRIVMQFRNFGYGFTSQFLAPTISKALKGDAQALKTLAALVIAGAATGKASSETKKTIREEFSRAIGARVRNSKDAQNARDLLLEKYGDLAASGSVGLIDWLIQATRSRSLAGPVGGPTIGEMDAFNRRVWPHVSSGDFGKAARAGTRLGLEQHFPIFGRQLGDYFFPGDER